MTEPPFRDGKLPFHLDSHNKSCETYYKIYGDPQLSTPVIVLHGGPGSGHEYVEPFSDLWTHYHIPVILYDQIGCAKSTHLRETKGDREFWQPGIFVAELENLVRGLGVAEYFVLGHSWGGTLAVEFAAKQPPGLRRLILAGANASFPALRLNLWDLLKQLPEEQQVTVENAVEKKDFTGKAYMEAMGAFLIRKTMLGESPFILDGSIGVWDGTALLPKIDVPTLVFNGEHDTAQERSTAPFFHHIPRVRWVTMSGASHMSHLDSPEMREKTMRRQAYNLSFGRPLLSLALQKITMAIRSFSLVILLCSFVDFGSTRATGRSVPKIREGREHLHNNLVNHAVALEDIDEDLPFASVRHLYSTHPNSVIHDAGKKAAALTEMEERGMLARSADNSSEVHSSGVHVSEAVAETDTVPPTHTLFFGAFTGAVIRGVLGIIGLGANSLCTFLDKAFGDDKNTAQIFGVVGCYIGMTLLGLYSLFSAGHNLYKLQQAGQRVADRLDAVNQVFELQDTIAGGVGGSRRKRTTTAEDVHEMMKDEIRTHELAVWMAAQGYKYEAAGLMSTIRPVSLQTKNNHTSHLWQELHDGKIRKTHVLTRLNVQIMKRDECENSNNEEGEDPQATLCSSGDNEGFTGVYESFDMFQDENSYEVVDYGMGDSKYADDVARFSGDLMKLGGTGGVCIYPTVNNQTALTILSAIEMGGRPSQTYAQCPSVS
ncbi:hypothetical protein PRZ48_005436 [Zasmidium cellare]|uniref:AB hydrolase-1 domain-containing protein n=1 Tax=Zasmidium cellare TaxID=395010 RepID=A0ABR0ETE1_ZASCE|nr:hypothetical protein PRZ48_005436 [Zasmidium cellare]